MSTHTIADFKREPFLAAPIIGKMLGGGCLDLFLGAGVSKGFGLPDWTMLVARILGRGNDSAFLEELEKLSDKELSSKVDEKDTPDRQDAYLKEIHDALYQDVKKDLSDQLSVSPLLLAVAALVTGSCRGRIDRVFTYNYDDLLEQYLTMLGYAVCKRISPYDLSTRADVEVNHVHGFLPQSWKQGDSKTDITLSDKSYRDKRSFIDRGWSPCVEQGLYSKLGLFVGLSGQDDSIIDVINRAKPNISHNASRWDYSGFWLMTPSAYAKKASVIQQVGMCPIPIEKELLPRFVFKICQEANK